MTFEDPLDSSDEKEGFGKSANPSGGHIPAVYLSAPRQLSENHPLDLLLRLFMLDRYGALTETRSARFELRLSAWLLLIVMLYEGCAWFLFLNFLISSRPYRFTRFSWLAVGGALLIASAVFVLERGIMVSDLESESRWTRIARGGTRLVMICASAIIATLALELVGFKSTLDQMEVRQNIVETIQAATESLIEREDTYADRFRRLVEGDGRVASKTVDSGVTELGVSVVTAADGAARARQRISSLESSLTKMQNELPDARSKRDDAEKAFIRARERREDAEQIKVLGEIYATRQREFSRVDSSIRQLSQDSIPDAKDDFAKACQEFIKRSLQLRSATDAQTPPSADCPQVTSETAAVSSATSLSAGDLDLRRKAYADWIHRLIGLRTYEQVDVLKGLPDWMRPNSADRTGDELLLMINDLIDGTGSPILPISHNGKNFEEEQISPDERLFDIQKQYNAAIADIRNRNALEAQRMRFLARLKLFGLRLVGLLIPVVALLYKYTSGSSLRDYFSEPLQAAQGHPEALAAVNARFRSRFNTAGD